MYLILREIEKMQENQQASYYYFLANYSDDQIDSNQQTYAMFLPEECRLNGKLFKMWTAIGGDFNSPQEAFNDLLVDRKTPQKKFYFIEHLADARNILNSLRDKLIESYRENRLERRQQINYYILNINIREIIKVLPNEFIEVSDRTNINYEDVPHIANPIIDNNIVDELELEILDELERIELLDLGLGFED